MIKGKRMDYQTARKKYKIRFDRHGSIPAGLDCTIELYKYQFDSHQYAART